MRSKIENNICGRGSAYGFLTGSVSEYLEAFDAQILRLIQRIELDRKHWETMAVKMRLKEDQEAEEFRKKVEKYNEDLVRIKEKQETANQSTKANK